MGLDLWSCRGAKWPRLLALPPSAIAPLIHFPPPNAHISHIHAPETPSCPSLLNLLLALRSLRLFLSFLLLLTSRFLFLSASGLSVVKFSHLLPISKPPVLCWCPTVRHSHAQCTVLYPYYDDRRAEHRVHSSTGQDVCFRGTSRQRRPTVRFDARTREFHKAWFRRFSTRR